MFKRRKPTFIEKFEDIAKEEGFDTISDFVNDWISKGGTFKTLYDLVLLRDIKIQRYTVWLNLRNYLTIPYSEEDGYWYKWNSLAKTKGKNSIVELMEEYKKKYTTLEIAREFDIEIRAIEKLINRIDKLQNKESKKFKKRWDAEGFCMTHTKERWLKIVSEQGYKSLREAVYGMHDKGLSKRDMADVFGVSLNAFRVRMKRANIVLSNVPIEEKKHA